MFQNPYAANYYSVPSPYVPYTGPIPGGVQPGKQIHMSGDINGNANEFKIDLRTNHGIAFHFNPRFNDQQIVRNSEEHGHWGPEERHGIFPFRRGAHFDLTFIADHDKFRVYLNNQYAFDFRFRCPVHEIQSIGILGDVRVHNITFSSESSVRANEVFPGPAPFNVPLRGVSPGKTIQLLGNTLPHGGRFSINLDTPTGDIAFHVSVRFDEGNVVVRNSLFAGQWGPEERSHGPFPFAPGAPFEILILCDAGSWKLAVNGRHFVEFRHRGAYNFVSNLRVDGGVNVSTVREY